MQFWDKKRRPIKWKWNGYEWIKRRKKKPWRFSPVTKFQRWFLMEERFSQPEHGWTMESIASPFWNWSKRQQHREEGLQCSNLRSLIRVLQRVYVIFQIWLNCILITLVYSNCKNCLLFQKLNLLVPPFLPSL